MWLQCILPRTLLFHHIQIGLKQNNLFLNTDSMPLGSTIDKERVPFLPQTPSYQHAIPVTSEPSSWWRPQHCRDDPQGLGHWTKGESLVQTEGQRADISHPMQPSGNTSKAQPGPPEPCCHRRQQYPLYVKVQPCRSRKMMTQSSGLRLHLPSPSWEPRSSHKQQIPDDLGPYNLFSRGKRLFLWEICTALTTAFAIPALDCVEA